MRERSHVNIYIHISNYIYIYIYTGLVILAHHGARHFMRKTFLVGARLSTPIRISTREASVPLQYSHRMRMLNNIEPPKGTRRGQIQSPAHQGTKLAFTVLAGTGLSNPAQSLNLPSWADREAVGKVLRCAHEPFPCQVHISISTI